MPGTNPALASALLAWLRAPTPNLIGVVRIPGFEEMRLALPSFHHLGPLPRTRDRDVATQLLGGLDDSLLNFYQLHDGARILSTQSGDSSLLEFVPIREWPSETRQVQAWLDSMPVKSRPAGLGTFIALAGEPRSANRLLLPTSGRHRGQLWFLNHESPRKPRIWADSDAFVRDLQSDPLGVFRNDLDSDPILANAWRSHDFHALALSTKQDASLDSEIRLTPRNQDFSIALPEDWIPEEVTRSVVMLRRATEHFGARVFLDRSLPEIPWESPRAALELWIRSFQSLLPLSPTRTASRSRNLAGKTAWTRELRGVLGADLVGHKTTVIGQAIAVPHGDGGLLAVALEILAKNSGRHSGQTLDLLEQLSWNKPRPRPWSSPGALASLADAASAGNLHAVRHLLEAGSNPNAQDPVGVPALIRAAESGHLDILRELLRAGADPEATPQHLGHSALAVAVRSGRQDLVRCLLEHGARGSGSACQPSPLHLALRRLLEGEDDSLTLLRQLWKHGARLDPTRREDAQLLEALPDLRQQSRGARRKLCDQLIAWFGSPP